MADLIQNKEAYQAWEVRVFGNGSYGRMAWHAFNDSREPETQKDGFGSVFGTFDTIKRNADVADHPSRIQDGWTITRNKIPRDPHGPNRRQYGDGIAFTDRDAAIAYAKRLAKFGRWAHGWSGDQDHNLERRKKRLQVKVVEVYHAHVEQEVYAA